GPDLGSLAVSLDAVMCEVRKTQHQSLSYDFLPPEAPLAMPEQALWRSVERSVEPSISSRYVFLRRIFVFISTIAMTIAAANEMYQVLQVASLTILEMVILALFVMLFAWIAFSFVSALVGFFAIMIRRNRALDIEFASPL